MTTVPMLAPKYMKYAEVLPLLPIRHAKTHCNASRCDNGNKKLK